MKAVYGAGATILADHPMKLLNPRAVVTGGASGIGEAIAIAFAQEGADVAILEHQSKGVAVAERVDVAGRRGFFSLAMCGNSVQVLSAFTEVDGQLGGIDIWSTMPVSSAYPRLSTWQRGLGPCPAY